MYGANGTNAYHSVLRVDFVKYMLFVLQKQEVDNGKSLVPFLASPSPLLPTHPLSLPPPSAHLAAP